MADTNKGYVLVVEDDDDIRDMIAQILESEGYAVVAATNGARGLEQLRLSGRPDLVLVDLMMPVMNGWEFRAALLKDPRLVDVPVVVLSGDGNVPTKASSMNATGFLRKPVDLALLLATVERFC